MGGQEIVMPAVVMSECIQMQLPHQSPEKPVKINGIDAKDRFSNSSILSILTRSYTKTAPLHNSISSSKLSITIPVASSSSNSNNNNSNANSTTNSTKVIPINKDRSPLKPSFREIRESERGKEVSKEPSKVSNLFSRFSITGSTSNINPTKKGSKIISKGPGSEVYVRSYFIYFTVF